tara:strand:- start:167 stop:346 length:180 start_codon:yes stop_codon:yes gene_type:complete
MIALSGVPATLLAGERTSAIERFKRQNPLFFLARGGNTLVQDGSAKVWCVEPLTNDSPS